MGTELEVSASTGLAIEGLKYSECRLTLPQGVQYEQWEALGKILETINGGSQWWLADWWQYGEHKYGEAAAQAAPTGLKAKTLQNVAFVGSKIPPSRRRESLSFSHHSAVAALDEKTADDLLDQSEQEGWSVAELRAVVRSMKAKPDLGLVKLSTFDVELVTTGTGESLLARPLEQVARFKIPAGLDGTLTITTKDSELFEALSAAWSAE